MHNFKVLIVEDELLIAETLKIQLEGMNYSVAAICRSANDALKAFTLYTPDIIIMDIRLMGDIDGVELAGIVGGIKRTPIIYLTDNQNEALRKKAIFETDAAFYITKPFNRLDIVAAMEISVKSLQKELLHANGLGSESYFSDNFIFIRDKNGFRKILTSDILFLKADRSYCELFCPGRQVTFSESLNFFEIKLAFAKELVRIHRSYMINVNHVQRIQENRLWINDHEIPIGKTYRHILDRQIRFI